MSPPIRTLRVRFTPAELDQLRDDWRKARGEERAPTPAELERWVHACVMASFTQDRIITGLRKTISGLLSLVVR